MQLIEIVVPLALGACAGWLSAIGWRPLAVVMAALALLWCAMAVLRVGPFASVAIAAGTIFLAYPCGKIIGRFT
jgi:hypothetical protein